MSTNRRTIPDQLRRAILADGRTLYRLAADSRVSHQVLARFIRGERDIRLETAEHVCRVLGLDLKGKAKGKGA